MENNKNIIKKYDPTLSNIYNYIYAYRDSSGYIIMIRFINHNEFGIRINKLYGKE